MWQYTSVNHVKSKDILNSIDSIYLCWAKQRFPDTSDTPVSELFRKSFAVPSGSRLFKMINSDGLAVILYPDRSFVNFPQVEIT